MADVFLPGSFLQQARGFTFKDSTGVTWTFDGTTHELSLAITAGAVGSFDEAVDDRVAALFTDSASLDLTYDDAANTLTAAVNQGFAPTWTGRHIFNPGAGVTSIQANGLLIGDVTAVVGSRGIEVLGTGGSSFISAIRFGASANPATVELYKSRNASVGANTIVQSGDAVGAITAYGANGTGYDNLASIQFVVDTTPGSSGDMPGRISFYCCPDGSVTLQEGARLSAGLWSFRNHTTTTTAPSAGGAGALPATPTGYITLNVNGTNRQFAYY